MLHRSSLILLIKKGIAISELKQLSLTEADILLQWMQEADRQNSTRLNKFLRTKGKGVQSVLDIGRGFID